MSSKKTITTIEQLKETMKGELVELPGWNKDQTVTFRLRRSSLQALVIAGKIPNPLLAAAQRLYEGADSRTKVRFDELMKTMRIVVDDALVEPRLDELTAAGVELTEEQFAAIWQYAQRGAAALVAFRAKPVNTADDTNGEGVEGTPE
ncbi:MAG: hypothetical protein RSC06_07040 [Clostridia bacterium]